MPDIDLKPDEYGERDPKTGLRKVKDDPRVQWIGLFMGIGWIVVTYLVRDQLSLDNVIFGAAFGGVIAGANLWPILSRLDR